MEILSRLFLIIWASVIAVTAYIIMVPNHGEYFTEFYVLGPSGVASDDSNNLTSDERVVWLLV